VTVGKVKTDLSVRCFFEKEEARGLDGTEDCEPVRGENYCYGCGQYVCGNHCMSSLPFGGHEPDDHLDEGE